MDATDKLFQYAENEQQADPATREALRYRTALFDGFQSIKDRPLCATTAVEICSTIKGTDMDIRRAVGTTLANEAIHPFTDGNGRSGRILNVLYLIKQELLTLPTLYLTHYIVRHKADYYRLLNAVTSEQAWESWVLSDQKPEKNNIAKRQTASEYLKQLASIGVLQEVQAGKEKLFIHPRLIRLLTQDKSTVETYT